MRPAAPKNPALSHLDFELEWLRALLEVRIREMQAVGLLPGAEHLRPGVAVYPQEVEARLRERQHEASDPTLDEIQAKDAFVRIDQKRQRRYAQNQPFDRHTPLAFLRQQYHLSDAQYLLFLLTVAPAFNPTFARLYAFIQNHFDRQYATLSLFIEVFSTDKDCAYWMDLISPDSVLLSEQLIEIRQASSYLPPNTYPLSLPQRMLSFIGGKQLFEPAIGAFSELRTRDSLASPAILGPNLQTQWRERLAKLRHLSIPGWNLPLCFVTGPSGAGKRRFAQDVAKILEKDLLCVDIKSLYASFENFPHALSLAVRESILHDALLCLYGWEKLILPTTAEDANFHAEISALHLGVCRVLDACLSWHPSTIIITCQNSASFAPRLTSRNVEVFPITMPDHITSLALWEQTLPSNMRDGQCDLKAYADSFRLTPGQIKDAVREAAYQSMPGERVESEHIVSAIKEQMRHRLSEHATLLEKKYRWEDLIVPKDVEVQLREIVYRYRYRAKVLTEWGLGDRFGHDLGLSALFDGPPGTGKSMCAALIANEIGIDVYQVDLSRVMSKYVGETEKNLAQIFNEAENAQAMLLFDEADSLFGQRTNVKSSNDKYANLEVNYLLQRIERFPGVAILTTNFPAGIDEAFARRLSLRVSFPKPSKTERARLWQSMLKSARLPKGKIDVRELATEFEISGGYIRNAILRAAFMAASTEGVVDQDTLYQAARIEMKSMGMLVSHSDEN
ncbi:MAG: ATP-binding protein [Proteobacteria bacterium]|nr:ATP-binding protein [Pseudomonadota bacterium]